MNFQKFRVFLFGSHSNNAGPDNVNRNLIENCQYELLYTKTKGKIIKRLEWIFNLLRCDVVVFSGFGKNKFWMDIARIFNKKTIYLMHGCASYEARINKLQVEEEILDYEKKFLKSVDLILPVSEQYKNWVLAQFPEFKNKTHYLNSGIVGGGIDLCYRKNKSIEKEDDKKIRIIVAGGDRIQKNNIEVCKAVEMLANKMEKKIELKICGRKYYKDDLFKEYKNSTYIGMLPYKEFCKELKRNDIFILNSEVESFGLSAVDALLCGCNILISINSGIRSVLKLKEEDTIYDVHNPIEIAEKIEKVLQNKNSERILSTIDFEHYSWKQVSERLYKICYALYTEDDYKNIV